VPKKGWRPASVTFARSSTAIPTTAWTTRPDGYCDFLNQRWLDYAGMTAEQALGGDGGGDSSGRPRQTRSSTGIVLGFGAPVDAEARMRRYDGRYRWFPVSRESPAR